MDVLPDASVEGGGIDSYRLFLIPKFYNRNIEMNEFLARKHAEKEVKCVMKT